jgi:hypothetical protein
MRDPSSVDRAGGPSIKVLRQQRDGRDGLLGIGRQRCGAQPASIAMSCCFGSQARATAPERDRLDRPEIAAVGITSAESVLWLRIAMKLAYRLVRVTRALQRPFRSVFNPHCCVTMRSGLNQCGSMNVIDPR